MIIGELKRVSKALSLLFLPFFLVLFLLISPVYAPVNLLETPEKLGDALGIGTFAGGIMATVIMLGTAFILIGVARRKTPTPLESLLLGLPLLGLAVAMAWFPVWFFAILIALIAFLFGKQIIGVFRSN